ncbi:MAG: hypothetical protein FJ096_03810 [Deltaproteobacteria bacterium]|nr:hypothetical protein [Deltaproteobacteria bacterium]
MTKKPDEGRGGPTATPRVGQIWYATKADPLLALEPVLWLQSPDGDVSVLEPVGTPGTPPPSAVQAVLGAAGFLAPPKHMISIKSHDGDPGVVKHVGFEVPQGRWGAAFGAVKQLSGKLGGWTTVLAGQTGFHAPTHLSEILGVIWERAGMPAWCVAHAAPPTPMHGPGVPPVLTPYALTDVRVRAIDKRFGGLDRGGSGSLVRQKTHLEVQDDLKLGPQTCAHCGGRLYEEDGVYFCENAADEAIEPDERVVE